MKIKVKRPPQDHKMVKVKVQAQHPPQEQLGKMRITVVEQPRPERIVTTAHVLPLKKGGRPRKGSK